MYRRVVGPAYVCYASYAAALEKFDAVDKTCYTLCRMDNFNFVDLFAGIGGIRIPFEKLGGTCVFSSALDKRVQQIFAHNLWRHSCHLLQQELI